ncbi:MAG: hypothetical protein IJ641_09185, partial [Lachnospiraceae bacterium]|nr:hypothetical protein [Lachnospiraceae bacterium]
ILAALGLYTTVRVLITKAYVESIVIRMYLGTVYLVSVIMYIYFMISAPYYSSMDFRYVLYLVPLEALMLGIYIEKSNAAFRRISLALTGVFAVSAAAVYLLLSRA